MLGNPEVMLYDKATDKWSYDKAKVEAEFKAVSNALSPMASGDEKGIRLLPWAPWWPHPYGLSSAFQPYQMTPDRKKFVTAKFNTWYFPIVRDIITLAKKYDLKTWFCWMDKTALYSPWQTNIEGIKGLGDPNVDPVLRAWIKKCNTEFVGLDVRWCWGNEMQPAYMTRIAKNVIFPMMKSLSLNPKKMTYGAAMMKVNPYVPNSKTGKMEYTGNAGTLDTLKGMVGAAFGDYTKLAIWKEVHRCGGATYPTPPDIVDQGRAWWLRKVSNKIRVWFSDDAVKDGDSKCDFEPDGARPSAARWTHIVKSTTAFGNDITYEHLPQSRDISCQVKTLKAIYKAMY